MAGQSEEDRNQPASQRRLDQARAEGDIPLSREVSNLAGLAAAGLLLMIAGPSLVRSFAGLLAVLIDRMGSNQPAQALKMALVGSVGIAAPFAVIITIATATSVLLQTGFVLKVSALKPDLNRLDPRRGLSRLFGVDSLVELVKSLVKLSILGWAGWHAVSSALPALGGAVAWDAYQLVDRIFHETLDLILSLIGAQAVIAGADIAWMRYRHAKRLRMTLQDVKTEAQEQNGNPHVKGKLRQMRMRRARRRMLAAVPQAAVVVTNPTHYAIALSYDRGGGAAPRIVAKGVDDVAARIRAVAIANRVPIVASPPLARALYGLELDTEIPGEHFKVVAGIIAYVWRLRDRTPARPFI